MNDTSYSKQLWVLRGVQEGAHVHLSAGTFTIGTEDDKDIVLQGLPEALNGALLQLSAADCVLTLLQSKDGACTAEPRHLGDYEVVTLGDVSFCMAPAEEGMEHQRQLAADLHKPEEPVVPVAAPAVPLRQRRRSRWAAAVCSVGIVGVLPAATVLDLADARIPANTEVNQLQGMVERLSLAGLTAGRDVDGRLMLYGHVDTRAEERKLKEALATTTAAVQHRYVVGEEVTQRAGEFLQGTAATVDYAGAGVVRIGGALDAATALRVERLKQAYLGLSMMPIQVAAETTVTVPDTPLRKHRSPIRISGVSLSAQPPYFTTDDGTRYYEGSALSDGARVESIGAKEIAFIKQGARIVYPIGMEERNERDGTATN